MIAGGLASRIERTGDDARDRAASTQSLYDFSRKLSATVNADDVIWAAVTQLQEPEARRCRALRRRAATSSLSGRLAARYRTRRHRHDAARWAFDKQEPAGNGTGTLPNSASSSVR